MYFKQKQVSSVISLLADFLYFLFHTLTKSLAVHCGNVYSMCVRDCTPVSPV